MFSYRHIYHAGNHADILKHLCLLACVQHIQQKEGPVAFIDTHAGAGLYPLHGREAQHSGEARNGILKLMRPAAQAPKPSELVLSYLDILQQYAPNYPGSPLLVQHLLRPQDKLKLFELFAKDARTLERNLNGAQTSVASEDGFLGLKKSLPPPSRRGLVLLDPSYEIKTDYARVAAAIQDALRRFATGVYLVWYPIVPRPEAHQLPRRLKTLAQQAGKPWLHARLELVATAPAAHSKLNASGIFVINPPHTLHGQMHAALTWVCQNLAAPEAEKGDNASRKNPFQRLDIVANEKTEKQSPHNGWKSARFQISQSE